MPTATSQHVLDTRLVRALVSRKAKSLIGKYGLTRSDRQDIEQELRLDLIERLPKFDPSKSKQTTFIARLLDRKAVDIIRHQMADCRNPFRVECSLDEDVDDGDGTKVPRVETIASETKWNRLGAAPRPQNEQVCMAEDVAAVVASLPDDLQDICTQLQDSSQREICRNTGLSRGALRGCLKVIRERFAASGLDGYLQTVGTTG